MENKKEKDNNARKTNENPYALEPLGETTPTGVTDADPIRSDVQGVGDEGYKRYYNAFLEVRAANPSYDAKNAARAAVAIVNGDYPKPKNGTVFVYINGEHLTFYQAYGSADGALCNRVVASLVRRIGGGKKQKGIVR